MYSCSQPNSHDHKWTMEPGVIKGASPCCSCAFFTKTVQHSSCIATDTTSMSLWGSDWLINSQETHRIMKKKTLAETHYKTPFWKHSYRSSKITSEPKTQSGPLQVRLGSEKQLFKALAQYYIKEYHSILWILLYTSTYAAFKISYNGIITFVKFLIKLPWW